MLEGIGKLQCAPWQDRFIKPAGVKIKTFHVIGSNNLGGAENFFIRLVNALARAGHETIAVTRAGGPIAPLLAPEVSQLHLPFAFKWDYWSRWQLGRMIARHQPDVVQTYMGRASRLTRVPAGSRAVHVARLGGYYKIRGYYDHADAWVGNTRDIRDYLLGQGLPAERVFHIGNFVPLPRQVASEELDNIRKSLGLPEAALVLFALGRMIPKKGFHDLVEAFALLCNAHQGRPLALVLAGEGPERARCEALAQKLGVLDRVRFVGWQIDPTPYFKISDIFICPSRHEPLGNVILEAWTNGLPVLSTLNEGAEELVGDGSSALLVPVADAAAMAEGLRSLVAASESELQALAEEGRRAVAAHSEEAVVGAYLRLYGDLVRMKSRN